MCVVVVDGVGFVGSFFDFVVYVVVVGDVDVVVVE